MKKKSIMVLILIAFSLGLMKLTYDYGRPVGYEAYAITESGKKIPLPDEWIHIAWTPQYLIASGFHNLVNALPALVMGTLTVASTIYSGIMGIAGLAAFIAWLIRRKSGRDPSGMINGGPYKFF
ncbi:MAG: hypothetical protein AB1608_01550 [Thermoproteota archaeon]